MKIRTAFLSAATVAVLAAASPAFARHSSEAAQNAAEAKTTAQLNDQQLAASGGASSGLSGATNATANPSMPSNERSSTAAGFNSPDANANVNSSTSATPGAVTDQNSINTGATTPDASTSTSTSSDATTTTAPK